TQSHSNLDPTSKIIVPGTTIGGVDVDVANFAAGNFGAFGSRSFIERVSVASDGTQLNEFSLSPSLSADRRYVAYATASTGPILVYDHNSTTVQVVYHKPTGGLP